jgi:hypothetical protein
MNTTWEYQIIFIYDGYFSMSDLNEAGAQGWEAVGMSESDGTLSVLLKRPISN